MARIVRISSISFGGAAAGERRPERALKEALTLLQRAALDRPDIVCLPETFTGLGCGTAEWATTAEEVPGPTTDAVGAVAREHRMYVLCPMVRRDGGHLRNSAVLLNRRGEPACIYDKIHPTIGEIEAGILPGTSPGLFETDFGRIGCLICYDLNFRDVMEGLAEGEAEVVFFPSMYPGGLQLRAWAHDLGAYVVSAFTREGSAIVDPLGRVLIESQGYQRIISRELNLDRAVLHIDYNEKRWPAIKEKYGPGVEIDVATPEAAFMLVSYLPDVTVRDLIREFNLELRADYFARANAVRESALFTAETQRTQRMTR